MPRLQRTAALAGGLTLASRPDALALDERALDALTRAKEPGLRADLLERPVLATAVSALKPIQLVRPDLIIPISRPILDRIPVHGLFRGIPRSACTAPVSPVAAVTADTLLEAADPAAPTRFYLPQFKLAEQVLDGVRRLRVRLAPAGAGWSLEIALTGQPRPGGTDPLPITLVGVLRFTVPSASAVVKELPLAASQESPDTWIAQLALATISERDELFHALTEPDYRCQLVLRCRFDAAVPSEVDDNGEQRYRQRTQQVDVVATPDPLLIDPRLHPQVFAGITDVGDKTYDVIVRPVEFGGRTHHYYQDEARPYLFRYLPDAFKITRKPVAPHTPNLLVRFSVQGEALADVRASVEYMAAPVVEVARLQHASGQLAPHLPSTLPAGVSAPVFEPLVVSNPDDLTLVLNLPRATGSGNQPLRRTGVVANLTDPFADELADLPMSAFQTVFDALFGKSAVAFSGGVEIKPEGKRVGATVPFVARLGDLDGPVFADSTATGADGAIELQLRNATESPLVLKSLPARFQALVRFVNPAPNGDRVGVRMLEADVTALEVEGAPVAFPVELGAEKTLKARLAPRGLPAPVPVLRKGDSGPAVAEVETALNAAGHAIEVDGSFGEGTEAAVRAFQVARGIAEDGVVGAFTRAALGLNAPEFVVEPPMAALYDLDDVELRPAPEAVWNAIVDTSVPAEYPREIRVVTFEDWYVPKTDLSAIGVSFEHGDSLVLRPGSLEGVAEVRVPVSDLVLRRLQESEYAYTLIWIRGTKQTRESKTGQDGLLVPELAG
jgi:hypothetical protein